MDRAPQAPRPFAQHSGGTVGAQSAEQSRAGAKGLR